MTDIDLFNAIAKLRRTPLFIETRKIPEQRIEDIVLFMERLVALVPDSEDFYQLLNSDFRLPPALKVDHCFDPRRNISEIALRRARNAASQLGLITYSPNSSRKNVYRLEKGRLLELTRDIELKHIDKVEACVATIRKSHREMLDSDSFESCNTVHGQGLEGDYPAYKNIGFTRQGSHIVIVFEDDAALLDPCQALDWAKSLARFVEASNEPSEKTM